MAVKRFRSDRAVHSALPMSKVGARLLLAAALASLVLAFALLWGFDYSWRLGPFRLRIADPLRPLVVAAILSLAALVPRRSRPPAFVLVMACGAAALIAYARTADAAWAPAGDIALIEAYTLNATNAELLLGPYSRFGWNHPGPLYFYLQAPFYVMSGYRSAGLSVGALVINLSALGILVWVCVRAAPQGFLAIAISAASVLFAVLTTEMLASQWNPHVLVFPTLAIVVVAAAVAAGRIRWLPVLAGLASFVVQTHLGLGPAVVALSGAATAAAALRAYLFRSSDATRRLWPILNGTLWLLLLLWLLPIAQELSEPDGNLSQLWTLLRRRREARSAVADRLQDLVRHDFSGPAFGRSRRMGESIWAQPGTDESVLGDCRNGWGCADRGQGGARKRSLPWCSGGDGPHRFKPGLMVDHAH